MSPIRSQTDLLLMNQMVAMVMEKKASGLMGTWTRAAVRAKRMKMPTRLKATRKRSLTLRWAASWLSLVFDE